MFNVLLVDDEEWICKLIRKIVDWNDLEFNIIAEAHDGITALELIKKHKPSLVVTDIRMPGLDGNALIKETRDLQIKTEFIIISGYSDFEYARSALSYDAFGYLLKPLDKEDLTEVLINVREKIKNDNLIEKKIEHSDEIFLEKKFINLLTKIYDEEDKMLSLEVLNQEYNLHFQEGLFQVALCKFDPIQGKSSYNYNNEDIEKLATIVKEKCKNICYEAITLYLDRMETLVCILNYQNSMTSKTLDIFNEILMPFKQNNLSNYFLLTIGIGIQVNNIMALNDAYFSSLNAIKSRIKLGKEKVIQLSDSDVALKHIISIDDEKKMQCAIDIFDTTGFDFQLKWVFKKSLASARDNPVATFKLAYEIVDLLINAMREKDINNGKELVDRLEVFEKIDTCSTEQEIIDYISKIFNKYIEKYESYKKQNSGNKLINIIKAFVSENYMKDISLIDAAKLVYLNPTYLSELFKRETGENFSEYLTSYRISIAKGLLKDVKYKVVDIAQHVGYTDPKYFSKLFRKNVGVNPTEYKRMYP